MTSRIFSPAWGRQLSTASAAVAGAGMILGTSLYSSCQRRTENKNHNSEIDDFRVEVHLMDKIQQKAYLSSAKDGIPSTLRILAIDLPEMRTSAFSGECRLSHDKIFVDDIADPKTASIGKESKQNNVKGDTAGTSSIKQTKLKVGQKALVKSLVQCSSPQSQQRIGVELLEASVAALNKYELRRTHQFGNFKYDPGKYYDSKKRRKPEKEGDDTSDEELDEVDEGELDKASFEDEIEAPWNQYAWAEEMRLRINGQVAFEAPMEKAGRINRYLFGQAYKITVHPISRFWELPLPSFARSDPEGVDGRNRTNCLACNKPHAVIANGASLQRVPSSLRLLQKLCKKADVPLFVIHDPRVWGGNTHQTLPEALQDMRSTIKNRVIAQALKQQGFTAFARGRMMGQLETEAKWQLKEQKRKSQEMFGVGKRRRHADSDWSQLETPRLERRLIDRGVIREDAVSDEDGRSQIQRSYTDALIDIARRCVQDVEEDLQDKQVIAEDVDASSNESNPTSTRATV